MVTQRRAIAVGSAPNKNCGDVANLYESNPLLGVSVRMTELKKVEQCIAETNSRIECQRRLIETLGYEGHDIGSAQIVFDSLCITLSLHLQHRYRLDGSCDASREADQRKDRRGGARRKAPRRRRLSSGASAIFHCST